MIDVRCIPTPSWAREPDVHFFDIRLSNFREIQAHREKMLSVVHGAVTEYVNDPDLVCDLEGHFPQKERLTGEYYVGNEYYETEVGPVHYIISIQTRFMEKPWLPNQSDFEYLGLEVWLACYPEKDWEFSVTGIDSASV